VWPLAGGGGPWVVQGFVWAARVGPVALGRVVRGRKGERGKGQLGLGCDGLWAGGP
jgi:hypothetical protein